VDEVLDHEQRRRPIVELFAPIRADVDTRLAAALTDAVGLGQFVVPGLARQVLRQTAAAVGPAPPLGLRRLGWLGRRRARVLARGRLRKEQELVGVNRPFRKCLQ
jgi:hypothetical protein